MILPCLLLLGFLASPADQAAASSQDVKQNINSWNCTIEKTVKVLQGEAFTIYSHVDPNDRCHFLFTHQDDNYQCCYEDKNDNNCEFFNYINDPRCLQNDNYAVKIDSRGRSFRNTCNFTTFNADSTSYGTYQVFNNEGQQILVYKNSRAIQKCNIVVEKTQISSTTFLAFQAFAGLVCLILFMQLVVYCSYQMGIRERIKDEQIFRHLSEEDSENFKKKLGRKSIFNLRDTNHNNIYHIASQAGWTESMNKIVIDHIERENWMTRKWNEWRVHPTLRVHYQAGDEAQAQLQAQEPIGPKEGIFEKKVSTLMPAVLTKCLDSICPNWFWPNIWDYPNTNLDSKNKDGDTPLMIAAGQGQLSMFEALIENGANVKVTNGKETVLYKAMLGYSASRGGEDGYMNDYINIFFKLEKAGVPFLDGNGKDETLLQMIVRLGDDYRDIVKTILDQDKDKDPDKDGRWKKQNLPTTLYNAVAGGHKDILNLLIEHGKLQWKNYNGGCLRTAVEKNNKTAVNFIFGKTFPLPTDDQTKGALELAKKKREEFKKSWKTNETITANHIIDKLSSIVSRPASIDPRKDEKDQYMSFLDHVRGKSNDRAYEDAIEDLAKFAHYKEVLENESDREGESHREGESDREGQSHREGEPHRERVVIESSFDFHDPDSSDTEEDPDSIRIADDQPLQDPPSR